MCDANNTTPLASTTLPRLCGSAMHGFTTFVQVIPVLFRIKVLLCNVLIVSLFLITTLVSFRAASLTVAGSPLYYRA